MAGAQGLVLILLGHKGAQEIDINAKDEDGDTPLHLATRSLRGDIVNILLDNGALATVRNNSQQTPAFLAFAANAQDKVQA